MDTSHDYPTVNTLAKATGRRDALHSLVAAGLALLAALGLGDASAKGPGNGGDAGVRGEKKRRKKRKKRAATGVQFATRVVISEDSIPLLSTRGDTVGAFADCGGEGKVVSCGFRTNLIAAEYVSVFVAGIEPNDANSGCNASLLRIAEENAFPGATIQAVAVCLA